MKYIENIPDGPKSAGPYSIAVIHNDLVFISGQLPIEPETGNIDERLEIQVRQCFKNLEKVLESAGSSFAKVVKVTLYLSDMKDFAEVNRIYSEFFWENFPARTCVGGEIPRRARLEIDVIASV